MQQEIYEIYKYSWRYTSIAGYKYRPEIYIYSLEIYNYSPEIYKHSPEIYINTAWRYI